LRSKYILKNITLLNLLLISVIVFLAYYALFPLIGADIKYALPSIGKTALEKADSQSGFNPPTSSSYTIIADNNLFHPERKIPPEKKTAEEQQSLPKPDVVLYGTIISDTLRFAYLEDLKAPRNTPGRGRRQSVMKIGDALSGFVLKEIDTDKIVMAKGEEKMTVYVHETGRLKTRETPPTQLQPATGKPAARVQAPPTSTRPATAQKPSVESLVKPAPTPKTRARMTGAEERALDVFRRVPP
jgi:hypothetical protein